MRVFLAHPKAWTDAQIDAKVAEVRAALPAAEVISGRDSFAATAHGSGSWSAWATEVGSGTDANGDPTFDLILVPDVFCGKATAQIVDAALRSSREVIALKIARDIYGKVVRSDWFPVVAVQIDEETYGWKACGRLVLDEGAE